MLSRNYSIGFDPRTLPTTNGQYYGQWNQHQAQHTPMIELEIDSKTNNRKKTTFIR